MNQNLKLRIMTALVGIPLVLILLLGLGLEGVALFAWIVSTGMLYEFSKMFFTLPDSSLKTFALLSLNTLIHLFNYWLTVGLNPSFVGLAPFLFLSLLFLLMLPKLLHFRGSEVLETKEGSEILTRHFQELLAACFGMLYAGWLPMLMVQIRQSNQGKFWLILTMLIVWSSDTFAYFAGKYFGKNRLFELVSPKKTWEGAVGGGLGALIVSMLFSRIYLTNVSIVEIAVIALTVSIASVFGDLCESLMKRAVNKKDSGSILPGHGGFLDRFDGVVFALPVMAAFLWLLS